ncbi:phage holin family protein [Cohnella ginsengisoli]|uniref:Phage holin family protein n=1 Tax=Cohnella ginsengisoli TaxID=425004 RepID=A0A9X4KIT0_9BACL|nr:phage holin family protein [Cohnella ginsengisoli]MDG0792761.1 phage holin family protein [Cohnella ginsengisoli]
MEQLKQLLSNAWCAAAAGGKEAFAGGMGAAIGMLLTSILGGWDKALEVLFTLIVLDYVSGVTGAVKNHNLNSDKLYWGGIRKIVVLAVVALAAQLDNWLQPGVPLFRTAAIYFYVGREGLSLVENFGALGVTLPVTITKRLEQFNQKGEDSTVNPIRENGTNGK